MKKRNGFTLIELLAVVSIIGVMAGAGLASYSGFNIKARDAKQKADVEKVRSALALYMADYNGFPTAGTETAALAGYFSGFPTPPGGGSYTYSTPGCSAGPCQNYYFCATLETDSSVYCGTPSGISTSGPVVPTATPVPPTATPTAAVSPTPTPTPVSFPTATPTLAPTVTPTPTISGPSPTPTRTPTPTATATPVPPTATPTAGYTVYLNSATGYSCLQMCQLYLKTYVNCGTDTSGTNGLYRNFRLGRCENSTCNANTSMSSSFIVCNGITTRWTYCKCQ